MGIALFAGRQCVVDREADCKPGQGPIVARRGSGEQAGTLAAEEQGDRHADAPLEALQHAARRAASEDRLGAKDAGGYRLAVGEDPDLQLQGHAVYAQPAQSTPGKGG